MIVESLDFVVEIEIVFEKSVYDSTSTHTLTIQMKLKVIISGGQTGADRAGLDFARECGFYHGGFCPAGRRAEDGRIPNHYKLIELDTDDYKARTELNALISDATLIVHAHPITPGSALTVQCCEAANRPYLLIPAETNPLEAASAIRKWVWARNVRALNVAGSRESRCPGIYAFTLDILRRAHDMDRPE